MEGDTSPNWSESIEDLVNSGDIDKAISVLESLTSNLQTQNPSLLFDLANLYSAKGLSLKADQTRSRALTIKHISNQKDLKIDKEPMEHSISTSIELSQDGYLGKSSQLLDDVLSHEDSAEDDWEAIADRAPDELLSSQCVPGVSELSLEDTKVQTPKRRGRGTFSYKKQGLYSDQQADEPGPEPVFDDSDDEVSADNSKDAETRDLKYGTSHVLVLADFSPSIRTTDLEKLLENFKDRGFVIRWVNDTVALAVFRTPSIALEARNFIQCPFTVRVLDENDVLLSSIPPREVDPWCDGKCYHPSYGWFQIRDMGATSPYTGARSVDIHLFQTLQLSESLVHWVRPFYISRTTSSKASDISKNCPKVDCQCNGN